MPKTDQFWDNLAGEQPVVAIIAPPLDTIPSLSGNAIYVLTEKLATGLSYPTIVLARGSVDIDPEVCNTNTKILYYNNNLHPNLLENILPYRVRKACWGIEQSHLLNYAKAAARACQLLRMKVVIVEDIPQFCPYVRSKIGCNNRLILHQHHTTFTKEMRHANRIRRSVNNVIFVANRSLSIATSAHTRLNAISQVIYNGVDLQHFCPHKWQNEALSLRKSLGISVNALVILLVGRLIRSKGIVEAIESFNLAAIPNSHLLVVGDLVTQDNGQSEYARKITNLAFSSKDTVHLLGVVSQKDLPRYYAATDVVIVPSIGNEGLPKVVTESLAMGRPVIASDRGGIWELLDANRNGWLLADPTDPLSIAKVIITALGNRDRLASMSLDIMQFDRPKLGEDHMIAQFNQVIADQLSFL